jgi:hypothetical protein
MVTKGNSKCEEATKFRYRDIHTDEVWIWRNMCLWASIGRFRPISKIGALQTDRTFDSLSMKGVIPCRTPPCAMRNYRTLNDPCTYRICRVTFYDVLSLCCFNRRLNRIALDFEEMQPQMGKRLSSILIWYLSDNACRVQKL